MLLITKSTMLDSTSLDVDWHDTPLEARSQLAACPQGCRKSHARRPRFRDASYAGRRAEHMPSCGFRAKGSANSGQLSGPLQCELPSSHRCKHTRQITSVNAKSHYFHKWGVLRPAKIASQLRGVLSQVRPTTLLHPPSALQCLEMVTAGLMSSVLRVATLSEIPV